MIRTRLRFLATLSLIGLTSVLMQSQSLELRPGYIAGSVAVGTETISYLSVNASSGSQSSSFNQSNVSAYSLTVNVPAGTTPTYSVRPTVYMDGNIDYIQLPSQNLVVSEGQTSQLDFTLSPAYVRGTVTVLNGTLQDAYIYSDNYAPATGTTSSANSRTNLSRGSQFRFAVAPGNVRAWATIYFGNGTQATVPVQSLGTVTAGSEVAFDITVTAPATDGAIQGTLSIERSTHIELANRPRLGPRVQECLAWRERRLHALTAAGGQLPCFRGSVLRPEPDALSNPLRACRDGQSADHHQWKHRDP